MRNAGCSIIKERVQKKETCSASEPNSASERAA